MARVSQRRRHVARLVFVAEISLRGIGQRGKELALEALSVPHCNRPIESAVARWYGATET